MEVLWWDVATKVKFKNIINKKLGETYETKEVKGITENIEEESLINYIKYQNKDLFQENSEISIIKYWATKKNSKVYQAILQLDLHTYNKMTVGMGKLFIGYNVCTVYDFVAIKRCFKRINCNRVSQECNKDLSCPKCADSHELKNGTENNF
ncbi:unnamed protein product [Psylliodes chrysocephalus]|uniref:Uncharacterized protein n=1 Tax=Psylliodes chrysocephalus TaxID=3402493 RepID=A0A9P0GC18_9CUCU|nr:unnamed protein product [Psylliodes chrysocephala]